ncbi:hypothetical protein REPUB_Repub09cG0039700 [Reevesia pubescens]
MYGFEAMTFNIHGGYLEAIVRGHRAGLLTAADYNNLCQCETLDDIKMHLSATEYGPYLQNEPSPLHTTTIVEKCTLKLVDEYKHMLCQATEPLSTFLEYITYGHMIDNVVLIVTGTLHERDVQELLEKCHPLGMFDSIATLAVAQNMRELYRLVLVDTPLAPYFSECITSEDLDDMNIEIMRNTLYKAYLEDFYKFCQKLGGATAEIMSDLLAFEADRRAVNITINRYFYLWKGFASKRFQILLLILSYHGFSNKHVWCGLLFAALALNLLVMIVENYTLILVCFIRMVMRNLLYVRILTRFVL